MTQTPKQLPDAALQFVGQRAVWREDRPTVIEGEASLLPTEDTGLVLGVRWARTPDGKTVGEAYGLAQFLMERPDGTSRWSTPVLVTDETTAMPEPASAVTTASVILFKPSGKYYTEEQWQIPAGALGPQDMANSPDFRRIDGGPVLVDTQEPWGYPCLLVSEVQA